MRIATVYGPTETVPRAVPNFIAQALKNEPLTVYMEGQQTRSLCYVQDLVEGIYRLLLSDEAEPVNIGNTKEMTILELAQQIIKLSGSQSEIVFVQPEESVADSTGLTAQL